MLQVSRWPLEIQLGTQPPVGDKYFFLGLIQRLHYMLHVLPRVYIPFAHLFGAWRRKRIVLEQIIVVEAHGAYMHHVHEFVVPFFLRLSAFEFEHKRLGRVGQHDGMVGARLHFHFAMEVTVD